MTGNAGSEIWYQMRYIFTPFAVAPEKLKVCNWDAEIISFVVMFCSQQTIIVSVNINVLTKFDLFLMKTR